MLLRNKLGRITNNFPILSSQYLPARTSEHVDGRPVATKDFEVRIQQENESPYRVKSQLPFQSRSKKYVLCTLPAGDVTTYAHDRGLAIPRCDFGCYFDGNWRPILPLVNRLEAHNTARLQPDYSSGHVRPFFIDIYAGWCNRQEFIFCVSKKFTGFCVYGKYFFIVMDKYGIPGILKKHPIRCLTILNFRCRYVFLPSHFSTL